MQTNDGGIMTKFIGINAEKWLVVLTMILVILGIISIIPIIRPPPPGANNSTPTTPPPTPTPIPTPGPPITNSIGMEFVNIPAGEFDMGSPPNETNRYYDESPIHHVKIAYAFYLGKYEVTQKQWREVMGYNPSFSKGDNLPVENVSWYDAQEFIKKLNEKENTSKYRLPSEAEWEYAARAGTTTAYFFGNDESMLGEYAWYEGNSKAQTHEVGKKKPNPWGLYDMYGNVFEWVQDMYHNSYDGAPTDGRAWEVAGSIRVFRGGSLFSVDNQLRSAKRRYFDPDSHFPLFGLRIVRDV